MRRSNSKLASHVLVASDRDGQVSGCKQGIFPAGRLLSAMCNGSAQMGLGYTQLLLFVWKPDRNTAQRLQPHHIASPPPAQRYDIRTLSISLECGNALKGTLKGTLI